MIILVSDIGSTTTKLVAFLLENNALSTLGSVQEPTTVEAPDSDVTVGLFRAVEKLSSITGETLLHKGSICVPYFTTSSAGGGLQVMVVGYTMADSCRIARATAYSAGAVISGAFAIDSEKNRLVLLDKMSRPNPDMVLMAGGTNGGALSGVVTMAYLLNHAKPVPKYHQEELPLLFCGNENAREHVKGILDPHFIMSVTENVIPGSHRINLMPAIESVQKLFMEHVMKKAPGYSKVTAMVHAPVVPTPVGVAEILKAYGKVRGADTILVDMGGATTDIFSSVKGEMRRTVAANIGMSYSMSNTLAEAGIESVMRHLPDVPPEDVRRWVYAKSLFPAVVPGCSAAEYIEGAVAVEGLRLAWRHHLETGYNPGRPNWKHLISFKKLASLNQPMETLADVHFEMDTFQMLIGAGGIFSHASDIHASWLLAEAFKPSGVTTLYVDTDFRSPHLGAMMAEYPSEALDYYSNQCLRPVCRVLSPAWQLTGLFASVNTPSGNKKVWTGNWLYLPDTTGCSIRVFGPEIKGVDNICDGTSLLIDCRRDNTPMPMNFSKDLTISTGEINYPLRETVSPVESDAVFPMSLPFDGTICVSTGDEVARGECLGTITEIPPRHFVIDIKNSRSCPSELTVEEIMTAMTVVPGDRIQTGDKVFHHKNGHSYAICKAPVGGTVTEVVPPGIVMVKEDMSHDNMVHVVYAAKKMGVRPGQLSPYMRVEVGDFVYRNQLLCNDPPVSMCMSPCPGFITDIDYTKGTVSVHYNLSPITIESPLPGIVSETDSRREVKVSCRCLMVPGVLGFGKVVRGRFAPLDQRVNSGDITFSSHPPTIKDLKNAASLGAGALVCPSISASTLVSWLGREPGLFITGNEEVPLSLLILQGIGEFPLSETAEKDISKNFGSQAAVLPITKIRAGTVRPFLAISND